MYSETVQRILADPAHMGPLEGATHKGVAGVPGEGPYLILWLQVEGDKILQASFQTYGCPSAVASGSITATVLTGRTLQQAQLVEAGDILLLLGGLPPGKEYCADLGATALKEALKGKEQP